MKTAWPLRAAAGQRVRSCCCAIQALAATLLIASLGAGGCHTPRNVPPISVAITQAPIAAIGGPAVMQVITGRVQSANPGQQVVLYARSGVWWIQPFANQPFTRIRPDGSWSANTHLGTEYAALLVDKGYQPAAKLSALPAEADGVRASTVRPGQTALSGTERLLHFSGYDWETRSADSDHGGDTYAYDPANAWVDSKGYMHLRMQQRNGKWTCGEIILTRSLGYGTYRFVVQDTGVLSTTAVLGMFTWDDTGSDHAHREMDIELSRWGEANGANAQYVLQPFFLPENLHRFNAPAGLVTHQFRWQAQSITFASFRGVDVRPGSASVSQHAFIQHVKVPGQETIRISLYDFHHTIQTSTRPVEAVIQSFTYLP